jgi:RNA polymerase sigma-70 factor (ECF subfamily)
MENQPSTLHTRITLLRRLQQDDQAAWDEFVALYGPRICQWCRHWRLQDADLLDVTQAVLLKLAQQVKNKRFSPEKQKSFRGWLKTITYHAWCDYVTACQRAGRGSGDSGVRAVLESQEAGDSLVRYVDEDYERVLLEEASARVRKRVASHTWEAFRLTALEGLSGAEVAARLNMKVATVFVAKSEVKRMLQEEVRKLDEAG